MPLRFAPHEGYFVVFNRQANDRVLVVPLPRLPHHPRINEVARLTQKEFAPVQVAEFEPLVLVTVPVQIDVETARILRQHRCHRAEQRSQAAGSGRCARRHVVPVVRVEVPGVARDVPPDPRDHREVRRVVVVQQTELMAFTLVGVLALRH